MYRLLCEFERPFKRGHIRSQQLLFRVQRAHLEVVEGEFGMQAQPHRFQIGRAGLCIRTRRFNRVPHPAKHVCFVGHIHRDYKVGHIGLSGRGNQRTVFRKMLARRRCARCYRGIVSRPVEAYQRPRLPELRFRRLQVLIGNIDLFFQRVQLRILENLPPLAASNLIAGLSSLPGRRRLFVSRRRRRWRSGIARANRAAAEQKHQNQTRRRTSDVGVRPRTSLKCPRSDVRGPTSAFTVPPARSAPSHLPPPNPAD